METETIKRWNPEAHIGLSKEQVKKRIEQGKVNKDETVPTKTIKQIVLGNVFTLFNILNLGLAASILLVGSYKNLLFMGGVICNTLISIIQEIRTKKMIDKLSLLATSKAKVIREGKKIEIEIDDIVLDDVIAFKVGEQVTVDSILLEGTCEVNEAFITGEETPIIKKKGDMILSGSFLVSGHVLAKAEHIGLENYTAQISREARYTKKVTSVLMQSLNTIIKWVSILVVPLGIILFTKQMYLGNGIADAVVGTVAAVIGMIPEGLVLLTSTVLAVGIIKLSKYKVLVQELYCIETLARIDTLCLDKTGTLTEGKMEVFTTIPVQKEKEEIEVILNTFTKYTEDENATMKAIKEKYQKDSIFSVKEVIPFKSEKKYSGIVTEQGDTYLLGAPEFLLDREDALFENIHTYSKDYRVLVLIKVEKEASLAKREVYGFVLLQDIIRKQAEQTIAYFKEQGVEVKVISGDSPITVSSIAKRVGIDKAEEYIDMSRVKDEEIEQVAGMYTVFGRVTPAQKKALIMALKNQKHTVAMTGDGVNDVLALKEADCSIAMASGSDAARNVSQIVLLESNFDAMPNVVLEGRQTINNIERSATLFLTKTMYASMLAILFLFINRPYPFEPIQLTLTSVVAIGIPSFVLALETNRKRIEGNFFSNVFSKAFPFAFVLVVDIVLIMILSSLLHCTKVETSTLCVIMNAIVSFLLLYRVCSPFNLIKKILYVSMIFLFIVQVIGFGELFSLADFQFKLLFIILLTSMITFMILGKLIPFTQNKLEKKYK
ncbi:MAG: HAD-IC family P-type ATPase [Bacilli bacterium]|nr:HAD-IC family P-type ATPase [Bacilli bacterium]